MSARNVVFSLFLEGANSNLGVVLVNGEDHEI